MSGRLWNSNSAQPDYISELAKRYMEEETIYSEYLDRVIERWQRIRTFVLDIVAEAEAIDAFHKRKMLQVQVRYLEQSLSLGQFGPRLFLSMLPGRREADLLEASSFFITRAGLRSGAVHYTRFYEGREMRSAPVPAVRRGRPPIGDQAMTAAERKRRSRLSQSRRGS